MKLRTRRPAKKFLNKKKIKIRVFLYSFFSFLFIVVSVFLLLPNYNLYKKYQSILQDRNIQKEKLEELEKRRKILEERINALSTKTGKEKVLRKRFDAGKPGEKLFIVIKDKQDSKKKANKKEQKNLLEFFKSFWE